MLVVRGTIFTMFGINTIFLSPSLEAKFDRKVCPSAKLTRGEPWWLLGLCHVSLVNWERPCPPLPVLHSWTFRWPTELAGGLKGGTEVAATLTLHSWGWAGCPSGLEGHHGCNFSSSCQLSGLQPVPEPVHLSFILGQVCVLLHGEMQPLFCGVPGSSKLQACKQEETDTCSGLFWWVSAQPCRSQAAPPLYFPLWQSCLPRPSARYGPSSFPDSFAPSTASAWFPIIHPSPLTSLTVVLTFWSNPNTGFFSVTVKSATI